MDSKKVGALRKKYWEGNTSQEEEEALKKLADNRPSQLDSDEEYFSFLNKKGAEQPLNKEFEDEILRLIDVKKAKSKPKNIAIKYWYIAASLTLIISVSIIFKRGIFNENSAVQVVQVDTFEDPEKAFEETKKALLFLSEKLNQSSEYATQFSKFEQSQEILKQN